MNIEEIKSAINNKFSGSIVENDDLSSNQIEIKGSQWLEIATFMRDNPDLSFDQLECITGVDTGEESSLHLVIICIQWSIDIK